jgi:hypothetical protein
MADNPQQPASPYVPLTARLAPSVSPTGTQPPVAPQKLDNPPRTRVSSTGGSGPAPVQHVSQEPFAGLLFADLIVMRQALQNHQVTLSTQDPPNSEQLVSVKRILDLIARKVAPRSIIPNTPIPLPKPTYFPGGGSGREGVDQTGRGVQ